LQFRPTTEINSTIFSYLNFLKDMLTLASNTPLDTLTLNLDISFVRRFN
jgi:hypothetical protein